MFDSLFNQLGFAWTAVTVGTLLLPVVLLVAWQTARLALSTPTGQKFQHALARAFPHSHRDKPLRVSAGRFHCSAPRRRR